MVRCARVGFDVGAEGAQRVNQREFREVGRGVAPVAGEVGLAVDLWGSRCRRHTRKLREWGQSGVVTHLPSPVGPGWLCVLVLGCRGCLASTSSGRRLSAEQRFLRRRILVSRKAPSRLLSGRAVKVVIRLVSRGSSLAGRGEKPAQDGFRHAPEGADPISGLAIVNSGPLWQRNGPPGLRQCSPLAVFISPCSQIPAGMLSYSYRAKSRD